MTVSPLSSSAAAPSTWLVYISRGTDKSQFHLRELGSSTDKISDVEGAVDQAVLAGTQIGFATHDGDVSVLDLNSGQQIHLSIKLELERLIFDDGATPSRRSFAWSPDGAHLAFSGRTSETRTDIYIYNANDNTLLNLTENSPNLINDVGAWSTDVHWLSFAALERKP